MRNLWMRVKRKIGSAANGSASSGSDAPGEDPGAGGAPTQPTRPRAGARKQAVVLIHGMGEQIPMDTIKGFVSAVWERDSLAHPGNPNPTKVWSKPDNRTGSLELRRITTRESAAAPSFPSGVRTDFYELYWADLTAGSSWEQFASWVRYLLIRPWSRVPIDVRGAWILLWLASLLVLGVGLLGLIPGETWKAHAPSWLSQALVVALAAAAGAIVHRVATRSFGRVVRYTRADPDNIAARAAVRERGLALLRELHRDGTYDRVVVVGHSLGSILAYDLISYFWAERESARTIAETMPAFDALAALERAAAALEAQPGRATHGAFRAAQAALFKAMRSRQPTDTAERWLISDLVTIGSPLTHAEFLLASSPEDLHRRQEARELPVSPPYREMLDPKVLKAAQATGKLPIANPPGSTRLMAFPESGSGRWTLHHAAPFAAVRWTNLHDPARLVIMGDVISGPLRATFGPGIEDVDLAKLDCPSRRFSHTRYWDERIAPARTQALRRAVNLLDR